jgi:drug/metabolite transporter (DMT)-like permease
VAIIVRAGYGEYGLRIPSRRRREECRKTMPASDLRITPGDWLRLLVLGALWGGSFFFVGVAVKEVPPMTIVFSRTLVAALLLAPLLWIYRIAIPTTWAGWRPFAVLALLNNAVPFTLTAMGQTMIPSGIASVVNAMTPVFTVLILAAFGDERLYPRRMAGVVLGFAGVLILQGFAIDFGSMQSVGILLCLAATVFYGFAALWAKRVLTDVPPVAAATFQLACSAVMMLGMSALFDRPWQLPMPGLATWLALIGLAAISTALGFILFFQIIRGSGAGNVMLVTLIVPVTAILLGAFVLGETVTTREIVGALVIASALLIMDGRLLTRFAMRRASA